EEPKGARKSAPAGGESTYTSGKENAWSCGQFYDTGGIRDSLAAKGSRTAVPPAAAAPGAAGGIMSVASVGVRISDDFDELPLFDTPPLNGPTAQISTATRGVHMRAVEKQGDFLLLEADSEDGGHGGRTLGWADASCVVPTSFPALYQFATDLPDAVR
ncbi:unnamed protein product, partial [Ectocarpus sp. 4 AP-2014]